MGNKVSSLDLDPYFVGDLDNTPSYGGSVKVYRVKVNLPHRVNGEGFVYIDQLQGSNGLHISRDRNEGDHVKLFEWTPKTTMVDFEVIEAFTSRELKLAKGQVIGVIIIEPCQSYCKLYYDSKAKYGVSPVFTIWNHSDDAKSILNNDLTLGLDVLLINMQEQEIHLKEPNLDIKSGGKVWVPGLDKGLENYRHSGDESEEKLDEKSDESDKKSDESDEKSDESDEKSEKSDEKSDEKSVVVMPKKGLTFKKIAVE